MTLVMIQGFLNGRYNDCNKNNGVDNGLLKKDVVDQDHDGDYGDDDDDDEDPYKHDKDE